MDKMIIHRENASFFHIGEYNTRDEAVKDVPNFRGKCDVSWEFSFDFRVCFLNKYRTIPKENGKIDLYIEAEFEGNYPEEWD